MGLFIEKLVLWPFLLKDFQISWETSSTYVNNEKHI